MKKLIFLIFFIPSVVSAAAYGAGWNATSTTQGWIQPNRINGTDQVVSADSFFASSTTATSQIKGLLRLWNTTNNNMIYVNSNNVLDDTSAITYNGSVLTLTNPVLSSVTNGNFAYINSSGQLDDTNIVSYDGYNLLISASANPKFLGLGNKQLIYQNDSGVLTSSENLKFDSDYNYLSIGGERANSLSIYDSGVNSSINIERTNGYAGNFITATSSGGSFIATSNNRIGLGTTSPGSNVSVVGTSGKTGIHLTNGANVITEATLGPELVPALTSDYWTTQTGWENPIVGPGIIKNADGQGSAYPTSGPTVTVGTTYKLEVTITGYSAGTVSALVGGFTADSYSANGTYVSYIKARSVTALSFIGTSASRLTLSAVSLKAVTSGTGDVTLGGNLYTTGQIYNGTSNPLSILPSGVQINAPYGRDAMAFGVKTTDTNEYIFRIGSQNTAAYFIAFGNATLGGTAPSLFTYSTNYSSSDLNGKHLSFYSYDTASTAQGNWAFGGSSHTNTTGIADGLYLNKGFSPTSGSAVFANTKIIPIINQTGGANGITRGLYVVPALTSAPNWRSIETENNIGYAIMTTGTATSSFGGYVGIGTTTPQWLLNPSLATAPQLSLSAGAGVSQWAFRNAGGNLYFATTTTDGTATTTTAALTILNSGYVGINDTSPGSPLEVNGDITLSDGGISGLRYFNFNRGGVNIGNINTGNTRIQFQDVIGNGYAFQNSTAQVTAFFKNNMTVGIGTTSPSALLAVHGSGYISSNLFVGGNITSTSSVASVIPYASSTDITATLGTIGFPHASLSSTADQTCTVANTAYPITFDTNDDLEYIEHSTSVDTATTTVIYGGAYEIVISAIAMPDTVNKSINIWLVVNNENVANSNTRVVLANNVDSIVAASLMYHFNNGDKFQLRMSSDDAGTILDATAASAPAPASPSIIMTVKKVSK